MNSSSTGQTGRMTSYVSHTSVDSTDAYALSEWWRRGKNRMHFDLRPTDRSRDDEVDRLLSIGATQLEDHRDIRGDGTGWVTLADPEGNEFCVLRSDAERTFGATS